MGKRANGEGSIHRRKDGRWQVSFPTGIYRANGKPEIIYRYRKSKAEASETLITLQSEKSLGISHGKAACTTGDWINSWIEKLKASKLASATLTSYRTNFRLHIEPAIGAILLRDLNKGHLQCMLDKAGGSYSKFVKIYNIVHGALEQAVREGFIVRNPCIGVAFPPDDRQTMRVFDLEEQKQFIKALDGEYYRSLFLTYLFTGMRLGEGLPLTWADIDLERQSISVNKKVIVRHDYASHSAKQEVQFSCKTKSSKRTITITEGLVRVLTEHKRQQMHQAEQLGLVWSDTHLVFPNTSGNIPQSRNVQRIFERILKKANIDHATMHCLRHSYATRCFENDVDIKVISAQLGHASVKTTYDTYIHLIKSKVITEVSKLGALDNWIA